MTGLLEGEKVWILTWENSDSGSTFLGVYSTPEVAQQAAESHVLANFKNFRAADVDWYNNILTVEGGSFYWVGEEVVK